MKTTDSRDPLDRTIDDLLASRPLQPSDDFVARVLAAADEIPAEKQRTSPVGQRHSRYWVNTSFEDGRWGNKIT